MGERELVLSSWGKRFVAWLVDAIIVNIVYAAIVFSAGLPVIPSFDKTSSLMFTSGSTLFFIYWTLLEGAEGQSVGKMLLGLKVVDMEGNDIGFVKAAIESFGKAYLLLLDVIVGMLAFGDTRQRLFNRLSRTIVIRVEPLPKESTGVRYVKE